MEKVTAPTLHVHGEKAHTTPIERVFELRDEIERHHKSCGIHLEADAPHRWLNDTTPGRYRQKEAGEAWDRIIEFLDRVDTGYFSPDRVCLSFESDFAADYDFSNSVRYGTGTLPEPDMRACAELKQQVAEGGASREELGRLVSLYAEFSTAHLELKQ